MRRKKFEDSVLLLLGSIARSLESEHHVLRLLGSIAISLEKIAHPIVVMPDDGKLDGGRHTTRPPGWGSESGGSGRNSSRSPEAEAVTGGALEGVDK